MTVNALKPIVVLFAIGLIASACAKPPTTVLEGLLQSRRLSADMAIQFEKALEASNRAVMADGDAPSAARETQQATEALQSDATALSTTLLTLDYQPERALLDEFEARFGELATINRQILDLAALDTNAKARRLSFGAAQDAALRFASALDALRSGKDAQAHARASDAIAAVREMQVLQTPHIAEAQDVAMDQLEERMRGQEAIVRQNLSALSATAAARPAAEKASREFDGFLTEHAEVLRLSRLNTNVKSLALSLGRKRTLAGDCEEGLRALQQALEQRDISTGAR